jgi:hypothetical protein
MEKYRCPMTVIGMHCHLLVRFAQIQALPQPKFSGWAIVTCCKALGNAKSQTSNVANVLELQIGRH